MFSLPRRSFFNIFCLSLVFSFSFFGNTAIAAQKNASWSDLDSIPPFSANKISGTLSISGKVELKNSEESYSGNASIKILSDKPQSAFSELFSINLIERKNGKTINNKVLGEIRAFSDTEYLLLKNFQTSDPSFNPNLNIFIANLLGKWKVLPKGTLNTSPNNQEDPLTTLEPLLKKIPIANLSSLDQITTESVQKLFSLSEKTQGQKKMYTITLQKENIKTFLSDLEKKGILDSRDTEYRRFKAFLLTISLRISLIANSATKNVDGIDFSFSARNFSEIQSLTIRGKWRVKEDTSFSIDRPQNATPLAEF